jgi:hypothetical protein
MEPEEQPKTRRRGAAGRANTSLPKNPFRSQFPVDIALAPQQQMYYGHGPGTVPLAPIGVAHSSMQEMTTPQQAGGSAHQPRQPKNPIFRIKNYTAGNGAPAPVAPGLESGHQQQQQHTTQQQNNTGGSNRHAHIMPASGPPSRVSTPAPQSPAAMTENGDGDEKEYRQMTKSEKMSHSMKGELIMLDISIQSQSFKCNIC